MSALSRLFGPQLWPMAVHNFESRQTFTTALGEYAPFQNSGERAILGGFLADRLAYAFMSGYQSALQRLYPEGKNLASICITEAEGGHPRAIKSSLTAEDAGKWRLNGHKKWASLADSGATLLVAASTGWKAGQNQLKLVALPASTPGLRLEAMPATGFVPEIGHYEVHLEDILLDEGQILPGDAYLNYIKPFRTLEDAHVGAATCAYLLKIALLNDWPTETISQFSPLILTFEILSQMDPRGVDTHMALTGAMDQLSHLVHTTDALWQQVEPLLRERWQRDRAILSVASRARKLRFKRALANLGY